MRDGAALMLGFGHFAFAVRKDVIADLPAGPSLSTRNGVDVDYFELPADASGWWCASVPQALVHHIGNTLDAAEEQRIADFARRPLTDRAVGTPHGRRPVIGRYVPRIIRRGAVRAAAAIYARPRLARWLLPLRPAR